MAHDIVSAVTRFLTPEVVGKIASASGVDSSMAAKAVSAAVPTILSGLAALAARPGGGRQIADAVAEQRSDLGSLVGNLATPAKLADTGNGLLSSLLGGGTPAILASTMGKFLGISEGSTRTLIGLVTPLIMGVLGREQRTSGLDANGLARMLTDQQDNIAGAMPAGLARLLETTGLGQHIGSPPEPEMRTVEASRADDNIPRTESLQRMAGQARTSTQGASWSYLLLPLLALGALLWFLLPSGHDALEPTRTSQPVAPPAGSAPTTVRKTIYLTSAPDNWVSLGSVANDYVNHDIHNRAGQNLGTIKDVLKGPDGNMAAAVINVGRFLGIGDKDVAVPFSALQVELQDNQRRLVLNVAEDELKAAPAFERRKTSQ